MIRDGDRDQGEHEEPSHGPRRELPLAHPGHPPGEAHVDEPEEEGERDEPEGANEVHFLIEGDPKRGLTPAARYRAVSYVPLLEAAGLRCRVWPSRPDKYFTATARWQSFYARWPRLAMLDD